MFKKLFLLVAVALLLTACGSLPEEETTVDGIGEETGTASTAVGYNISRIKDVDVSIQPYTNGFKVTFTPVSSKFICSLSNYVVQGGSQLEFKVADTESDYTDQYSDYYDGYVESGAFDSCAPISVETVWVVIADNIGFDPSSPYQVILDDVRDTSYNPTIISVTP